MRQIELTSLLVSLVLISSCKRDVSEDSLKIPLTYNDAGQLVVPVKHGDVTMSFLVDSGASGTLVDAEAAQRLKLSPVCSQGSHKIETLMSSATALVDHVHDETLIMGGHKFTFRTLVIAPMLNPYTSSTQGILGMDFLQSAHAVIDIPNTCLVIGNYAIDDK